ncbi:HTH_48 domain-containing protein [Trichonephila clavipes]|nr:HTH_48 domain-containing protein [Trichonephila clavipes]
MSKQMVRRWCRQFSEGRQSVHDEERSGRPSLINVDLVELVRQHVVENRRFTFTELSSQFPMVSRSLLHEIVTKHPPAVQKIVCQDRVTGDETWTLPRKPSSRHCIGGIVDLWSGQKVMCTLFWDKKGILFIDFLPCGETKSLSSGERFGNDEELKTSVTHCFHSQAAEFFDRVIQKLIPRFNKCLNSGGGYVEK